MEETDLKISIVLPCRDEEETIGRCIAKVKEAMHSRNYEIIVSDSSKDRSAEIAENLGAKVIRHGKKGYGIACLEGFKHARGKYIIMGDADDTYDFSEIPKFLDYLEKGYDFVLGNRLNNNMERGAMSWLHRYIGNPSLSWILSLFFHKKIKDAHCGMRGFTKKALDEMQLRTKGMEFASEMVINALMNKLKIVQIPVSYHPRIGSSKLRSFSDGWRHLRFMLMYAPDYLFMVPGLVLFFSGIMIMALFLSGPVRVFGILFYNRPAILGSFFTILGFQTMLLGTYAKTYMKSTGFIKSDKLVDSLAKVITLEKGLLIGGAILLAAFLVGGIVMIDWFIKGFPGLTSNIMISVSTLAICGIQIIFSAFFLSILLIEK